jgi:hypothetical protein
MRCCCLMISPGNCILRESTALRIHCKFVIFVTALAALTAQACQQTRLHRQIPCIRSTITIVSSSRRPMLFIGAEPRLAASRVCVGGSHPCFGQPSDLARDGTVVQKRKRICTDGASIPDASNFSYRLPKRVCL